MKILTAILFGIMCIAQWVIPARMIYQSEDVIESGTLFKFETEPVDPSDPFRGKYITLNFKEDFIEDTSKWTSGEVVFVTFAKGEDGFARPLSIQRKQPTEGSYLRTKVLYSDVLSTPIEVPDSVLKIQDPQMRLAKMPQRVYFSIPFDRYYLEESKAQEAEEQYRVSQRDTTSTTYGLVRMGQGQAVLVDVMIDDKSIVDIVREINAKVN